MIKNLEKETEKVKPNGDVGEQINQAEEDEMINEIEAAEILNLHRQTLKTWRKDKLHLPFYKIGHSIRYLKSDVRVYRDSCRVEVA